MLTAGLPGQSAIADNLEGATRGGRASGAGLRALHDALPVESCPFDRSAEARRAQLPAAGADLQRLVVPHRRPTGWWSATATPCVPNTLIGDQADYAGHVDFGSLGRGDGWADIAVATWSTEWTYGPGWEDTFLTACGVVLDEERPATTETSGI